ncbi:phosphoadenylyl-sulfate reductase [Chondrinema litorale]|uniref:phosphoadenylyl-sulfate reductase n=1 Tax=Chondrinema litorale TaxID=2994555 RepID=UPI00254310E5|nr:phosphoadenylyl-sulfate reductase [Chondrinema litorale]UZR94009.1 phosphoadenylyl-sulfate reductase [Chondrinema litorale]
MFASKEELIKLFEEKLEMIQADLESYKKADKKLFSTSSFQTNSVPLLHIISVLAPDTPVYFLNTGYHFAETLKFRDELAEKLNLNIVSISSSIPKYQQKDQDGRLMYSSNPDRCCHINKIAPLDPILASFDVWINGVRGAQSSVRASFNKEEQAPMGVTRYHPMLDWNTKMVHDYIRIFELPRHPLEGQGYLSIGCQPCTHKIDPNALLDNRDGRWKGMNKTECGLHTKLVKK